MYDDSNVFAKIIREEIAVKKIYEDAKFLSFYDAFPQAKIHALVIPKDKYVSYSDFMSKASMDDISNFFKTVHKVIVKLNLEKDGYRLITNCGEIGGQEVPHFHFHILAGEILGKIR